MTSIVEERLRTQPPRLFPDVYFHQHFTEAERPDLALIAQQVKARGYLDAGFVVPEAIIRPQGTLHESIDEARGPNVDYWLARNPDLRRTRDRATLRHYYLASGGSETDFPAYEMCGQYMSPRGKEWLQQRLAEGRLIIEVASMAAEGGHNGRAVYEMLRNSIQKALGKNQTWFFSIVGKSKQSLTDSLGEASFTVLGEPAVMDNPFISRDITLQPVALEPDEAFRGLPELFEKAKWFAASDKTGEGRRALAKATRTILFFTDGIGDGVLSSDLAAIKGSLTASYLERMDGSNAERTAS